jgi:hypothetical protein
MQGNTVTFENTVYLQNGTTPSHHFGASRALTTLCCGKQKLPQQNCSEESIKHSEHGESLKSRIISDTFTKTAELRYGKHE